MREFFEELAGALERELAIYEEILDVSHRKTEVLTAGDVKSLDSITKTEQELILSIAHWEDLRYKIVKEMAWEAKEDVGTFTMTKIIERAGEKEAERLKLLQQKMAATLKEIEEVNKKNGILINKALEYIDKTFSIITSSAKDESVYGNDGSGVKGDVLRFFDHKI